RLYGARTVSSDPAWRYVNVRRLLMMIEEAVEDAIQWAVFEPNDFYLRQTLTLAISSFLQALWERGALVGETADQAFFVKCDEENNPPYVSDLGQLIAEVGVAPVIPAEFVVFRIGRTEDELEIIERDGGNGWPS
ncbi:MAG: phage tail sheath C-terminal domain-containing protein, partial [Anaerolineae bacterium]